MSEFQTISELDDFIKRERRMEIKYTCILLGTMIACFIVGILIGQIASLP